MMLEKINKEVSAEVISADINRLTNQLWKLIPMRENNENWHLQLDTVLIEVAGLHELCELDENSLILLSKLEGMRAVDLDFPTYRKTVFECISLLREVYHA